MLAFHNDPAIKAAKVAQVRAHQDADEIIKGRYWERGKGCAVGCTIHGSDHAAYETEMGVPRMLARLEDGIFEGMPNDKAKLFPLRFIEAIPVGADLSRVGWQFLHWVVADVVERHGTDAVKEGAKAAIEILRRKANGETVSREDTAEAREIAIKSRRAAYAADAAAAYAADAAAYDAAYAADAAAYDAAYAAADAAYAAAYDAAYAADAAAAYAAAYDADAAAAYAADAAADAADAARREARDRQAEKLLELLAAAPIPAAAIAA